MFVLFMCRKKERKMAAEGTSILIVYYSMYGHVRTVSGKITRALREQNDRPSTFFDNVRLQMAQEVKKGIEAKGAKATLMQVPETLSDEGKGCIRQLRLDLHLDLDVADYCVQC